MGAGDQRCLLVVPPSSAVQGACSHPTRLVAPTPISQAGRVRLRGGVWGPCRKQCSCPSSRRERGRRAGSSGKSKLLGFPEKL